MLGDRRRHVVQHHELTEPLESLKEDEKADPGADPFGEPCGEGGLIGGRRIDRGQISGRHGAFTERCINSLTFQISNSAPAKNDWISDGFFRSRLTARLSSTERCRKSVQHRFLISTCLRCCQTPSSGLMSGA